MFLGTKYSQVLEDSENTLSSHPDSVKVSSIRLQRAMTDRLKELANYAQKNYEKANNYFKRKLLDISRNHPSIQKKISGRANTPLQIHLDSVAMKVEFAPLMHSTNYLRVENSKTIQFQIPFDVLITLKEPEQKIRNMYIGIPNQTSFTKDWIVAEWTKEKHLNKVLKAEYIEDWLK
uniref:Uncharacterized protein n=1 Tax=Ditylenchus dipsaci TaxID=166011 RepID=A0A915CR84_9BILA